MKQQKLTLTLSLLSYLSFCQATTFINDDFFAYPRYKLEVTENRIPESSVFNHQQFKNKQIDWLNSQGKPDSEPNNVIMMSRNAQPFLCTIPEISTQQTQHSSTDAKSGTPTTQERRHVIDRGMELLKPLENNCLYFRTHGYWTYEYCHMQHVRQFHAEQAENGKLIVDEKASFILGKYSRQDSTTNDDDSTNTIPSSTRQKNELNDDPPITTSSSPQATLRQIGSKQALVYYWNNGTPCDITNGPRGIDIQFQCAIQDSDQIVFFEEVSICQYRMSIATPRLCDDLMTISQSHSIECNPITPEDWITDNEQRQDDKKDVTKATVPPARTTIQTTQQQHQQNDDDDAILTSGQIQHEGTSTTQLDTMEQNELLGMISDLSRQVEQLKKSIGQQTSMDKLLQQQNQVLYMNENGQLIWGSMDGSISNDNDIRQQQQHQALSNNDAIQTIIKQFIWEAPSSTSAPQQQEQQVFPGMDGSNSQHQNKKAYEKNYYSVD